MPSSANPPWYRDKHVWFRIVELVVILSATYIAWRSLERNTEGILASSSTQLFYDWPGPAVLSPWITMGVSSWAQAEEATIKGHSRANSQ